MSFDKQWYADQKELNAIRNKPSEFMKQVESAIEPSSYIPTKTNFSANFSARFKDNLDYLLDEVDEYIRGTYGEHYGDKVQLIDLWEKIGIAATMFRGDITKYGFRYGEKDGKNKKDLMKILHYTLLLLYLDHYAQGKDEGSRKA